jgi:hypothetical protein
MFGIFTKRLQFVSMPLSNTVPIRKRPIEIGKDEC